MDEGLKRSPPDEEVPVTGCQPDVLVPERLLTDLAATVHAQVGDSEATGLQLNRLSVSLLGVIAQLRGIRDHLDPEGVDCARA